jgi:hypothetical protein
VKIAVKSIQKRERRELSRAGSLSRSHVAGGAEQPRTSRTIPRSSALRRTTPLSSRALSFGVPCAHLEACQYCTSKANLNAVPAACVHGLVGQDRTGSVRTAHAGTTCMPLPNDCLLADVLPFVGLAHQFIAQPSSSWRQFLLGQSSLQVT